MIKFATFVRIEKRMKALNIIIILLSVVCTACTTIGIMENNRVEEVSFGSGGGFTGEIIKYTLNRDGNIYRNGSFIKRVPQKEVNRLFGKLKTISDYHYNISDNMYNFIEINMKSKKNEIVWGVVDKNIDSRVISIYSALKIILEE